MRIRILLVFGLLLCAEDWLGAADGSNFSSPPVAIKTGDTAAIKFAVSRETDVAVYIESAKGEIVRHLVAGRLGPKASEPFKPGLSQSIEWDFKDDDGRPAAGGPFIVRVGLGLNASWGGTAFGEQSGPNNIRAVNGLAVGSDGRLFVLGTRNSWLWWRSTAVHVLLRDGSYEKTIKPWPGHLPLERVKATGAFVNTAGKVNPLIHRVLGMTFYPYEDITDQQMAVTADGNLVLAVQPSNFEAPQLALAMIDGDGGVPTDVYAGPAVKADKNACSSVSLATASDGKRLFLSGFHGPLYRQPVAYLHSIYTVPLPERGPAKLFFGEDATAGSDESHLNGPRNVAVDGKGHILVADFGNNRVAVIDEKSGEFVSSFPVDRPEWVGVHPGTGAVYVLSLAQDKAADVLVKFNDWREPKEVNRISLPSKHSSQSFRWHLALDASTTPAVLWVGRSHGYEKTPMLMRCEDGGALGDLKPVAIYKAPNVRVLSTHPRGGEVSCMTGYNEVTILNEMSGQLQRIKGGFGNVTVRLGADGHLLGKHHGVYYGLFRWDRKGKIVPFPDAGEWEERPEREKEANRKWGTLPTSGDGNTAWPRGFAVDRQGNIYVNSKNKMGADRSYKIYVFSPNGKLLRTAVHEMLGRCTVGPRLDAAGNIYIADGIYGEGELPYPREFEPQATTRELKKWYGYLYGSLIKFGPEGGALWVPKRIGKGPWAGAIDPAAGLPAAWPTEKVFTRDGKAILQNAKWRRQGFSCQDNWGWGGGSGWCLCTATDFDVDAFGRVFSPDVARFRMNVLDTNGNEIASFGGYGNQDFCGPESYVLDPKEKFLRSRKPDDPKDLASPFAEPAIGFGWILNVAVTDRHVYVADAYNCRVLRVKLDYASEGTCEIK